MVLTLTNGDGVGPIGLRTRRIIPPPCFYLLVREGKRPRNSRPTVPVLLSHDDNSVLLVRILTACLRGSAPVWPPPVCCVTTGM